MPCPTAQATLATSYSAPGESLRAYGETGGFAVNPVLGHQSDPLWVHDSGGWRMAPVSEPSAAQFPAQIDEMANAIDDGRETITPGALGFRDVAIIEAIYASARGAGRVALDAEGALAGPR